MIRYGAIRNSNCKEFDVTIWNNICLYENMMLELMDLAEKQFLEQLDSLPLHSVLNITEIKIKLIECKNKGYEITTCSLEDIQQKICLSLELKYGLRAKFIPDEEDLFSILVTKID